MPSRLSLDLVMLILMLFAFAYQLTGNTIHEAIGGSLLILSVVHNALSWRWYAVLDKGGMSGHRAIGRIVNLLLLVTAALLFTSGIANSRILFPSLKTESLLRQIHVWAAYWVLVLGSIHLGLHWDMVTSALCRRIGITRAVVVLLSRAIAIIFVCYGLYASFERDIFLKLSGYYSFDYWDFNRFPIGFFITYLTIMSVYVCLGHSVIRLLRKKHHEGSGN